MTRTALTVTAQGDAQVDTAIVKSGSGSLLLDGTGDYLAVDQPNGELNILSGAWTVELWLYVPDNINRDHALMSSRIAGFDYAWVFSLEFRAGATDDRIKFNTRDDDAAQSGIVEELNASLAVTTWHHIAVTSNGSGTLRIWVNGANTQTATSQPYYALRSSTSTTNNDLLIGEDNIISGVLEAKLSIDEVRISNVERYTSSFTPASRFAPDANTLLLLHMDGADASTTFTDDVGEQGSATLNSTATLSASGGVQPGGKANLNIQAQIQIDAVVKPPVVGEAELQLFGDIEVTANPNPVIVTIDDDTAYDWDGTDTWDRISWIDRWWQGYRFPTITATVSVDAQSFTIAQASLPVEFTVTCEGLSLERADITINTEFDISATAEMTRNGLASLPVTTDLTSTSNVSVDGRADLDLEFAIAPTGRILKLVDIQIDPFATVEVTAEVTVDGRARIESQTAQQATATVLIPGLADLDSVFDQTTTADLFVGGSANLAAISDLIADGIRLIPGAVTLDTEFDISSDAILVIGGEATLENMFAVSASAENFNIAASLLAFEAEVRSSSTVLVDGKCLISDSLAFDVSADNFNKASANLSSSFTLTCDVFNFKTGSALLENRFDSLATAIMTLDGRADLDAFAATLTAGERLPGGAANLTLSFTFTSEGDLQLLDSEIVYHVLSETRRTDVLGEVRSVKVLTDSREHSVLGETNNYKILQETRVIDMEEFGA